jgi:hypothetical protein
MEINKLARMLFVISGFCFASSYVNAENAGLYMNGQWDPACAKCWPLPRTDSNNHCKPSDCALQGHYRCKMQNPPLAMDDDPRLISLIKSGQCTYAPSVSFNTGEASYIKSLNYCNKVLDKMAGRYVLPGEDSNAARNRVDFYFTHFKASIFGRSQDQLKLAMDYDLGLGTRQDRSKATELYQVAADKGVPFAQYAIAARYAYGISMEKDKGKAIGWLNKTINNKPMTQADRKAQEMVTPCAIKLIERLTPS